MDRRVALITGSSRGIGRAIAVALSKEGIAIIVNYVSRQDAAEEVVRRISALGGEAIAVKANVANFAEVESMFSHAVQHFGKIDILVNNAGLHRGRRVHILPNEDWDLVLNSYLTGAFYCCKLAVPIMLNHGWGRIVNISSFVGLTGWPGDTAYASAKAGLIGFSKSLAKEVAKNGITVNVVAPGFVETEMTAALSSKNREWMLSQTPIGRPVLAEEVAELVLFLVTKGSSITGAVIPVDGGISL